MEVAKKFGKQFYGIWLLNFETLSTTIYYLLIDNPLQLLSGFPVYNTQALMPEARPFNIPTTSENLSPPSTNAATSKSKNGADNCHSKKIS